MINREIFELADQLQNVVKKQMQNAKTALDGLPEGETKDRLTDLLRKASSGKVDFEKVQTELKDIVNAD